MSFAPFIVVPCAACMMNPRVPVDERTRQARCGTCGEEWIHRVPERLGDVVLYTGSDHSVLDYGPGIVVDLLGANGVARVRVTRPGMVLGGSVRAGESFVFARGKLTVIRTAAGDELPPIGAPAAAAPARAGGGA